MTSLQIHQRANRIRRIPRRIHQLLTTIRAVQARVDAVENQEDVSAAVKNARISVLRREIGPAHAQIRALQDRGAELGITPQLLNA